MEATTPIGIARRLCGDGARLLPTAGVAIVLFAAVPLGRALIPLFTHPAMDSAPLWESRVAAAFAASVLLAAAAGMLATAIAGLCLPLLFHPTAGIMLRLTLAVLFCVSPVVLLGGFVTLPGFSLLSPFGAALIIMSWKMAPIAVVLLLLGARAMAQGELEAARMAAHGVHSLQRLIIPRLRPAFLGAFIVTSALVLVDGELPSLVGYRNLPEEVLARITVAGLAQHALLPAVPLLLVAALATAGVLLLAGGYANTPAWRRADMGAWRAFAAELPHAAASARLITGLLLLPLLLLGFAAAPALLRLEGTDLAAVFASGWFALAAALLAAVFGYLVAEGILLLANRLLVFVVLLLLGTQWLLPGYLLGAGMADLAIAASPLLEGDRLLVVTHTVRALPLAAFAFLVLLSMERRADPVAELAGIGWWHRFRHLRMPAEWPSWMLVVAVLGALLLSELSSTILVVAPGTETAVLRMYNLMHYGAGDRVAMLALLQTAVVVAALLMAGRMTGREE